MRVIIEKDDDAVAKTAAQVIGAVIKRKPAAVLGLATGSTPIKTYQEMARLNQAKEVDFGKVTTFNLDEYWPLKPDHPQSYRFFMNDALFDHINIDKRNTFVPTGTEPMETIDSWCEAYERRIKDHGGIDMQVVGIGGDGHIAFNEPGSSLASRTRFKTLTEDTIIDNAKLFFNGKTDEVPKFAVTMGVGTVMEAKRILMLATGAKKAKIVAAALEGPVTCMVTASVLQMHPDVTVVVDEAAASALSRRGYHLHIEKMTRDLYQGPKYL
jgi:glucosamine-6-phosphate deaminase